ncbi:MAG: ecotin precursor, partial [Rhodocyclales bacterium]|nr:ecotin precursor [Rhodocyclales bacterium]
MKKTLVLLAVALAAVVAQPALADGRGHHHGGHRSSWLPFAAGAVLGGVVIGSMIQPQPVYA